MEEFGKILQSRQTTILIGQGRRHFAERPVDGEIGTIPGDAAVVFRRVGYGDLVENLGIGFERAEVVGRPDRYIDLVPGFGVDFGSGPFSEIWRAMSDVDGDIQNKTGYPAQSDPLCMNQNKPFCCMFQKSNLEYRKISLA